MPTAVPLQVLDTEGNGRIYSIYFQPLAGSKGGRSSVVTAWWQLRRTFRWLAALATGALVVPATAQGSDTLALVIANQRYAQNPLFPTLANPARDADLVSASLKSIGFAVERLNDASATEIKRTVESLSSRAAGSKVHTLLVYYAGHGLSMDDTNYLVTAATRSSGKEELAGTAATTAELAGALRKSKASHIFLIIDACRNEPGALRSGALARDAFVAESPAADVNVIFSTLPLERADDGPVGGHSPFAEAFADAILQSGQDIVTLILALDRRVSAATGDRQHVWSSGAIRANSNFCFGGCTGGAGSGGTLGAPNLQELARLNHELMFQRSSRTLLGDMPSFQTAYDVYSPCGKQGQSFSYCYWVRNTGINVGALFNDVGEPTAALGTAHPTGLKSGFPADFIIQLRGYLPGGLDKTATQLSDGTIYELASRCQAAYPIMTRRQCVRYVTDKLATGGPEDSRHFIPKRLDAAKQAPIVMDSLLDASGRPQRSNPWHGAIDRGKRDGCGLEQDGLRRIIMACFEGDAIEGVARVVEFDRGWWMARYHGGRRVPGDVEQAPLVIDLPQDAPAEPRQSR